MLYESKNENKIQELSNEIDNILKTIKNNKKIDYELLFDKLNNTKNTLTEVEILKLRNNTKISLNDLIPNYKEIAKELVKKGFHISGTFGSTSTIKKPPTNLVITFTSEAQKESLSEIYSILKPYGFDRIDYDHKPLLNKYNIYIGSYIDKQPSGRSSVKIDEKLNKAIFDDTLTVEELGSLILKQQA